MANRNLGTIALFFTIIATNFSAFFFLGFAGEGYRIDYPYYAIMAFRTAFACLSFVFIGQPVRKLGQAKKYITPGELVYGQTGSRTLQWLFAAVMVIFTFPYLALQLIGAGYLLESMTGGEVPYLLGATILTRDDVMEGVPEMVHEVQVEGTFPDGTKLVTVHDPIR